MKPKYFIGPMSKNVVDTVIEFCNSRDEVIGLIPSRRQVEWDGGYVNNWTTEEFSKYVKSKTDKIILQRDHSGPGQGTNADDGYKSLEHDCVNLDLIHIDPWKAYPSYEEGLKYTIDMIKFCDTINTNLYYEVATEQSIRYFDVETLERLLQDLQASLEEALFSKIRYLVIQSGTSLKGVTQTGEYGKDRLVGMVDLARKYNLQSKEHNGDYIEVSTIQEKFALGLDAINIAPEFGLIETQTYLDAIDEDSEDFIALWKLCYDSNRWVKWVDDDFDPVSNKKDLIKIAGHYILSSPEFLTIKSKYENIDNIIKNNILQKLNQLYGY